MASPLPRPDWMSEEGEDFGDSLVAADTANDIVDLISSYLNYHEVLTQLLQERNLDGYTPFMAAVVYKVCVCTFKPLEFTTLLQSPLLPPSSPPCRRTVRHGCCLTWLTSCRPNRRRASFPCSTLPTPTLTTIPSSSSVAMTLAPSPGQGRITYSRSVAASATHACNMLPALAAQKLLRFCSCAHFLMEHIQHFFKPFYRICKPPVQQAQV